MPKEKAAPAKPRGFIVIAAVDNCWGIGRDNEIPWRLKGDMTRFKTMTLGALNTRNATVAGRVTQQSLPAKHNPLPGRLNIVLTRKQHDAPFGQCLHANSLDEGLVAARAHPGINDVFVIGGGEIYAQALKHPLCERVELTTIGAEFDCDTFFPGDLLQERFRLASTDGPHTEGELIYAYQTYLPR